MSCGEVAGFTLISLWCVWIIIFSGIGIGYSANQLNAAVAAYAAVDKYKTCSCHLFDFQNVRSSYPVVTMLVSCNGTLPYNTTTKIYSPKDSREPYWSSDHDQTCYIPTQNSGSDYPTFGSYFTSYGWSDVNESGYKIVFAMSITGLLLCFCTSITFMCAAC